jgi:hypothetical protein
MVTPQRTVSAVAVCVAGMLSLAVAMGIGRFAFTPMLPYMIRDAQLDLSAGGWLASANYGGYLLGALTASRIPLGAARLGVVSLLLTALLTAAMAWPGPALLWLLLRLLAGVCSAWAFVATSVWCLGALAALGKPAWGAGVYAGVGLGMAVTGLYCWVAGVAAAPATLVWLQLGALALGLTLPVVGVLRLMALRAAPVNARAGAAAGTQSGGTRGLIICYGLMGFGYILPATFLPAMARSVVDEPGLFALAWPVFGLTAALSTLAAAWWLRRATRVQVWSGAQFLMGVGVLLPSLRLNGWTIALSALLVGGTFMVVTMAGVQEIHARGGDDPRAQVARMTIAFASGQIAGPLVSTLLLRLSPFGASGLDLALQAGAAVLLGSAAWLWRRRSHPAGHAQGPERAQTQTHKHKPR